MTSKLTREENVQAVFDLKAGYTLGLADVEILKRVARMALAAMESEPLAWGNGCDKTVPAALRYLAENERPIGGESSFNTAHLYQLAREIELMAEAPLYRHAQPAPDREQVAWRVSFTQIGHESNNFTKTYWDEEEKDRWVKLHKMSGYKVVVEPLYRHAQPAPDREQVRREHSEWSQATFGNVGPVGPLKHLSKEALEAAAEPGDLSEWADMQFLLWDAQRRAGITDEQITQAMIEKLAVNKQREWPEPKDGEPRLHIKAQPAPVVPEDIPASVYEILCQTCGGKAWMYSDALWDACRAAMLQAEPVCTCPSGDGSLRWPCPVHPGNSPVIPDGWILVPVEPNGDMLAAAQDAYGETDGDIASTLRAAIAAAPQEAKTERKK